MKRPRFSPFLLILTGWLFSLNVVHANQNKEYKQVQTTIQQVSKDVSREEVRYNKLQQEVTRLEKKLGKISKDQYNTEKKIDQAKVDLRETNIKHQKLRESLHKQQSALAQQLQAMYTAGSQSNLRLLLRQDNPSDISRNFRYFDYLNKNRMQRIQGIQSTLDKMTGSREEINKKAKQLDQLNERLAEQKADIQRTLQVRESNLSQLKSNLSSKRGHLKRLQRQERQLAATLKALERKRKKAIQAAQKKPIKTAQAATQPKPPKGQVVRSAQQISTTKQPFRRLRGKLKWPVDGTMLHKYKSRRNEQQRWDGVILKAAGGSPVRAVAAGRVAYASWMNGYGHLVIIEHDQNYMSLYGFNRAIYKKEGTYVKANEVIAAVGNSNGQKQNALYFSIRRKGTPQNPAIWCR